jgi:hypothetical protein
LSTSQDLSGNFLAIFLGAASIPWRLQFPESEAWR